MDMSTSSKVYQWVLTLQRTNATRVECTDNGSNNIDSWSFTKSIPFELKEYTYVDKYPTIDSGKYLSEHYDKFNCNSKEYLDVYHVFSGTKSSYIDIYFNSADGIIRLKAHNKAFEKNLSLRESHVVYKQY